MIEDDDDSWTTVHEYIHFSFSNLINNNDEEEEYEYDYLNRLFDSKTMSHCNCLLLFIIIIIIMEN